MTKASLNNRESMRLLGEMRSGRMKVTRESADALIDALAEDGELDAVEIQKLRSAGDSYQTRNVNRSKYGESAWNVLTDRDFTHADPTNMERHLDDAGIYKHKKSWLQMFVDRFADNVAIRPFDKTDGELIKQSIAEATFSDFEVFELCRRYGAVPSDGPRYAAHYEIPKPVADLRNKLLRNRSLIDDQHPFREMEDFLITNHTKCPLKGEERWNQLERHWPAAYALYVDIIKNHFDTGGPELPELQEMRAIILGFDGKLRDDPMPEIEGYLRLQRKQRLGQQW